MNGASWSRLQSVAQPALGTELRLVLELLSVLPKSGSPSPALVLPANVLVGADGSVQVGPLKPGDLETQKRYLAPEARSGREGEVSGDVSSAIYSVGALLFEAVVGVPFESPEVVQKEVVASRVAAKAAGLGTNYWELQLLEIAAKATRSDPKARWSSPTALSAALRRVAKEHVASREQLAEYAARFSSDSQYPSSGDTLDVRPTDPAVPAPTEESDQARAGREQSDPELAQFDAAEQSTRPMRRPGKSRVDREVAESGQARTEQEQTDLDAAQFDAAEQSTRPMRRPGESRTVQEAVAFPPSAQTSSPYAHKPTLVGMGAIRDLKTPEARALASAMQDSPAAGLDPHQTLVGIGVPVVKPPQAADQGSTQQAPPPESNRPPYDHKQTLIGVGVPVVQPPQAADQDDEVTIRRAPGAESAPDERQPITSDAEEPPDVESVVRDRPPRRRKAAGVLAATAMVTIGAAVPLVYYQGYFEWAGLGTPTDRGAEATTVETSVEAARVEAARAEVPDTSGPEPAPAASASTPASPVEEDEGSGVRAAADDEPCVDCPDQSEPDSAEPSEPASKPTATVAPKAAHTAPPRKYRPKPRPRATKLPEVRDYGI